MKGVLPTNGANDARAAEVLWGNIFRVEVGEPFDPRAAKLLVGV